MTGPKQMIMTLFIIAVVCAVVLSYVYAFTTPHIEETKKNLTLAGLKEVIDAQEFVALIPDTLWRAVDSLNNEVGVVFRVFPQGYGGPIPIMVGLDLEGKITSIRIASAAEGLKETPGLGAKITESDFTQQFAGKCASEVGIKKDGGQIEAITAATISSRAVSNGVRKGIETYASYVGQTFDLNRVFSEAQRFLEVIKDTLWYALSDEDTLGIVFIGITQGYLDCIKFMVGINKANEITGVDVFYSMETEGIGERIKDKEFLNKFKQGKPEAITGATISSQALIDAIDESIERFKGYLK